MSLPQSRSPLSRRQLLQRTSAAASCWLAAGEALARSSASPRLKPDPKQLVDLPEGFSYRILLRAATAMNDGYRLPARPDAMGVFAGPAGKLVLMCNHEVPGVHEWGPYGLDQKPPEEAWDPEAYGGVTRHVIDPRTLEIQSSNLVLTGTHWNCAGGLSPWGWLSCEEVFAPRHGYVFLCPHTAERLAPPRPIPGYGHFRHEAATVDPETHIAYLTEDREDAAFYRFVPFDRNEPFAGKLQALAIRDRPRFDSNTMRVGDSLDVTWVDVPNPDSTDDDVRLQASAAGAARFVRTEGIWLSGDALFMCATAGGPIGRGQIFRLLHREPERLDLIAHSEDSSVLDMPDNITVSPSGQLWVAEDGLEGNYLRHITPDGRVIDLARAAVSTSEFAGPCFSPDGTTLFVNIQGDGLTLAIRGPFDRLAGATQPKATSSHARGVAGVGAGLVVLALAALAKRKRDAAAGSTGGAA
jgi:secreted PhoX family phosphatase